MKVRVQNVWTYFERDVVVPFNLIKACSFRLAQDNYVRYRSPNIPLPPRMIYQPSRKRFLTGVLPMLMKKGFKFEFVDERRIPECEVWDPPDFLTDDPRYDYQLEALNRVIRLSRGIVKFVVGGGKTYLAAGLAFCLRCDHLIITFRRVIFDQFVNFFSARFDEPLGVYGGGLAKDLDARIVIASSGTLVRGVKLDLSRFDSVIVDEAHHIGWGSSISRILSKINAYYRVGLSGTPKRSGGDHLVTIGLLGPLIYNFGYVDGVKRKVIPPAKVIMYRYPFGVGCFAAYKRAEFGDVYLDLIVKNATRNKVMCELVTNLVGKQKSVLILVQRKLHGVILYKRLKHLGARLVFGDSRGREQIISGFKNREFQCLIATDSMFSEGVNIHGIDVVVCAGGYKSPVATIQRVGRALRARPGKDHALILDFFDETHKVLHRQSLQRRKCYKQEGYEVHEKYVAA